MDLWSIIFLSPALIFPGQNTWREFPQCCVRDGSAFGFAAFLSFETNRKRGNACNEAFLWFRSKSYFSFRWACKPFYGCSPNCSLDSNPLNSAYFTELFIWFLSSLLNKTYFSYYQMTFLFFTMTGRCSAVLTKNRHLAVMWNQTIHFKWIILMTKYENLAMDTCLPI